VIRFFYREDESGVHGWERQRDCAAATKEDLLWYFFPGSVDISGDGVQLAMDFGSVPALHFISALLTSRVTLVREGARFEYTFTEVDQFVWFVVRDGLVRITCSYASGEISASINQFSLAVKTFCDEVVGLLVGRYPALAQNGFMVELNRELRYVPE
jgi:hypothetical protein